MKTLRADQPKSRVSQSSAQTTVEFSLIVFIMLVLILTVCDYAQFYFYRQAMYHSLREGGRFCVTGDALRSNNVLTNPVLTSSANPSNGISRYESIKRKITNACVIPLPMANIKIASWAFAGTEVAASVNNGPGDSGEKVKIQITYPIKFISPAGNFMFIGGQRHGQYTVTVEGIFYNEPSKFTNTSKYTNDA